MESNCSGEINEAVLTVHVAETGYLFASAAASLFFKMLCEQPTALSCFSWDLSSLDKYACEI